MEIENVFCLKKLLVSVYWSLEKLKQSLKTNYTNYI